MLILVLADNLLLLYLGWEGVGLCSYLLIGFWYRDPITATPPARPSRHPRRRYRLCHRILILFTQLGTLNIQDLMQRSAPAVAA